MRLPKWGRARAPEAALPSTAPLADPARRARRSQMASRVAGMFHGAKAQNDRRPSIPTPPDAIISRMQMSLVAQSREQWSQNDYVRAYVRLMRQNVVGPQGVVMQSKVETARGKLDKPTNDALEADWLDFGRKGNCDASGTLSWRDAQALAIETAVRDGEFIVRKVYGADVGPHRFAIQFIDPQRLPVWYEVQRYGSGFIRHGIEFNAWGRPVAYHFTSTDQTADGYYSSNGRGFARVPADQIIHGFRQEMVGQRRGLPWTCSALFRLRNVNGFEDAAIQNARASASKMGFIQYPDGEGPDPDDDEPVTIDAEPLSFHELPGGATLAEWSPQFPSNETATFLKSQLRGAASGMGVPYNSLASDLEGVNFSSIRHDTLDAREHYKEIQEWLIETLVVPVRNAHLAWRLLDGAVKVKSRPIPADRLNACLKACWQARRWEWIDPKADVDSKLAEVRGGLNSAGRVIRERGQDPETVFADIAADLAAMESAGIPEKYIELFMQGQIAGNMKQQAAPKKEAAE